MKERGFNMEINKSQELEQLMNKAELMKRIYYKGFGNSLQGIFANCAYYFEDSED